jgi:hypothetical protein
MVTVCILQFSHSHIHFKPQTNTTTPGIMGFSIGFKTAAGALGSFKLPTTALAWGRKELYTPNMVATTDGSFIEMGFRYTINR